MKCPHCNKEIETRDRDIKRFNEKLNAMKETEKILKKLEHSIKHLEEGEEKQTFMEAVDSFIMKFGKDEFTKNVIKMERDIKKLRTKEKEILMSGW